jgi:PKD repeat protein
MELHIEVDENSASLWIWTFGDGTDTTTQSPSVTHYYEFEGNYTGTLTATNQWGCSARQDFTVEVPAYINAPNVFTPNGDGYNDYFEVKHNGRENVNFLVINRWGK